MADELFANEAKTTLQLDAGQNDVLIHVASAIGFPAAVTGGGQFRARISASPDDGTHEYVLVTNVSGTDWTVVRGIEGSVKKGWVAGSIIRAVITIAGLAASISNAISTALSSYSTTTTIGTALADKANLAALADVATSGDASDLVAGLLSPDRAPAGSVFAVKYVSGAWQANPTNRDDCLRIYVGTVAANVPGNGRTNDVWLQDNS